MRIISVLLLFASQAAWASLITISQPDLVYTASTQLFVLSGPSGTVISSLTNGSETLSFATAGGKGTTNSGISPGYGNWGAPPFTEGPQTDYLCFISNSGNCNLAQGTSNDITLSVPAFIFGFEAQPDNSGTHIYSVDFYNGGTLLGTISQSVNGTAGARLFAASSTIPITSVHITVPLLSDGYALARFRVQPVPEPGTLLLVGVALCWASLRRRRVAPPIVLTASLRRQKW